MSISTYNGAEWKDTGTIEVYNGAEWKAVQSIEVYNGVEWKECYTAFSMLSSMSLNSKVISVPGGTAVAGLRWYLGNPSKPASFNSMSTNASGTTHDAGSDWCDSPSDYAGDYECRFAKTSGGSFNAGNCVEDTWYDMDATVRTWYVQADASYGELQSITGNLEIRKKGTTSPVLKKLVTYSAKNNSNAVMTNPRSCDISITSEEDKEVSISVRGTGRISLIKAEDDPRTTSPFLVEDVKTIWFIPDSTGLDEEFEMKWTYIGGDTALSIGTPNEWLTLDSGGRSYKLDDSSTSAERTCIGSITIRRRGNTSDSITFTVELELSDY